MKLVINRLLSSSDRRVARQTFWLNSISAVRLLGGLAQISITARMLGVEGYGALAAIVAFCGLVHGLIAIPSGDTLATFVTRSVTAGRKEEAARIVRFAVTVSFGMSLIAYAAIAALTLIAANLLGIVDDAHTNAVLLYGVVGILGSTSSESLAVLRLSDRVSLGSIVALVAMLTRVGALGAAWYLDAGLTGVIFAYIAGEAVSSVGMFAIAAVSSRRAGVDGLFRSPSILVPPDVLKFEIGSFGRSAIGSAGANLDVILVSRLAGVADAGLYRAARQVVDHARQPFKQMSIAVKVEFSRMWYSNDIAGLRAMALRFVVVSAALALVGFGLLAYFGDYVVRVMLGDDFLAVTSPLLIMIIGSTVAAAASPLISLPSAAGRIHPSLVATGAVLVASTAFILWLVPSYGVEGAAWANTVGALVAIATLTPFITSMLREGPGRPDESSNTSEPGATPRIGSGEFAPF